MNPSEVYQTKHQIMSTKSSKKGSLVIGAALFVAEKTFAYNEQKDETKRIGHPTKNVNGVADPSSNRQLNNHHGAETESKFKDLSQETDVGDLQEGLVKDVGQQEDVTLDIVHLKDGRHLYSLEEVGKLKKIMTNLSKNDMKEELVEAVENLREEVFDRIEKFKDEEQEEEEEEGSPSSKTGKASSGKADKGSLLDLEKLFLGLTADETTFNECFSASGILALAEISNTEILQALEAAGCDDDAIAAASEVLDQAINGSSSSSASKGSKAASSSVADVPSQRRHLQFGFTRITSFRKLVHLATIIVGRLRRFRGLNDDEIRSRLETIGFSQEVIDIVLPPLPPTPEVVSPCSQENTITCVDGMATNIAGVPVQEPITCKDACLPTGGSDRMCCDDGTMYDPCEGLTAKICMDNVTCTDDYQPRNDGLGGGSRTCVNATIDSIYLGCSGKDACFEAGKDGNLGIIVRSCVGGSACFKTAYAGTIGNVIDGCNGVRRCYFAASNGTIGNIIDSCNRGCENAASNGTTGNIINSCNGNGGSACSNMANNGKIDGDIINSCNGFEPCRTLARFGTINGGIIDSCNGRKVCEQAAGTFQPTGRFEPGVTPGEGSLINGGIINSCNLINSTNGDYSCYYLGGYGATINGGVVNSCNNYDRACYKTAYDEGGFIGGPIQDSCNNVYACYYAAFASISTGLNNCCNGERECEDLVEPIPNECAP